MFYKCKNKKKIFIAIIAAALLLIMWGAEVWKVNKAFPPKTFEDYHYNEQMHYTPDNDYIKADVSITPVSCSILTTEDFVRRYPNVSGFLVGTTGKQKHNLVFTIKIKNNSDIPVEIERICTYFMYASPFNANSNGLQYINGNGKTEIQSNEEATVKLLSRVRCDAWYPNSYKEYVKAGAYIIITQYPVEKRLVFQIQEGNA